MPRMLRNTILILWEKYYYYFVTRVKQRYQNCYSYNSSYFLPVWGWCRVLQNVQKGSLFKSMGGGGLITPKGNWYNVVELT